MTVFSLDGCVLLHVWVAASGRWCAVVSEHWSIFEHPPEHVHPQAAGICRCPGTAARSTHPQARSSRPRPVSVRPPGQAWDRGRHT